MIITALIEVIFNVLGTLLIFNLPSLPEGFVEILSILGEYVLVGFGIIRAFVGEDCMFLMAELFSMVVMANAAYFLYSFVFFVIRKIPMLNVKE